MRKRKQKKEDYVEMRKIKRTITLIFKVLINEFHITHIFHKIEN